MLDSEQRCIISFFKFFKSFKSLAVNFETDIEVKFSSFRFVKSPNRLKSLFFIKEDLILREFKFEPIFLKTLEGNLTYV